MKKLCLRLRGGVPDQKDTRPHGCKQFLCDVIASSCSQPRSYE